MHASNLRAPTVPGRWPFWLATLVLVLAAVVAQLVPVADTEPAAGAGVAVMVVDAADPVAADADPDVLIPAPLAPPRGMQPRPVVVMGGQAQFAEPPPQRPPRPLA